MNDKFILLIAGNITIFYSFIEKKCTKFLFRCRMFVKEMIEGILSLVFAFIPKYVEVQKAQWKLLCNVK